MQPLLDAVLDYLPAPTDLPDVNGTSEGDAETAMSRKPSDAEPFSGLAFKVMADPFVGTLTFLLESTLVFWKVDRTYTTPSRARKSVLVV